MPQISNLFTYKRIYHFLKPPVNRSFLRFLQETIDSIYDKI